MVMEAAMSKANYLKNIYAFGNVFDVFEYILPTLESSGWHILG